MVNQFYECRPCKPKLQKLKTLLEENPFSGVAYEEDEDHQGKKVKMSFMLPLLPFRLPLTLYQTTEF